MNIEGKSLADFIRSVCKLLGISSERLFDEMDKISEAQGHSDFPKVETLCKYMSRGFPSRYYSECNSDFLDILEEAIDSLGEKSATVKQRWDKNRQIILIWFEEIFENHLDLGR